MIPKELLEEIGFTKEQMEEMMGEIPDDIPIAPTTHERSENVNETSD